MAHTQETPRPTDRELLAVLAKALQVSDKQAHDWLYTFDFDGVSDQLIDEAVA